MSTFFGEPDHQQSMRKAVDSELAGHRGIPDIAADADPYTGMAFYSQERAVDKNGGDEREDTILGRYRCHCRPDWRVIVRLISNLGILK